MTVEDKIKEMLVGYGMDDDDAAAVVKTMKAEECQVPMVHRWHSDVRGYSQAFIDLLEIIAKATALKYIDANCPLAWFRPMFV